MILPNPVRSPSATCQIGKLPEQPVIAAPAPPAIANQYGPQIHVYGRDGEKAVTRIIRQAITGQPGDALTGVNDRAPDHP